MEEPHELTTRELIDQLFAQHDAEVHAIFAKLLNQAVEVDNGETDEQVA